MDKIFVHATSSENALSNTSSFSEEMNNMAYINAQASANSLIIIDELGRSTSSQDSLFLSIAICEKFLEKKVIKLLHNRFIIM